jgi:chemotaxis protein MotB
MADEQQECPEIPKCPECPPPGAPAWMATFSDLVTLLLTFFVLLYAMSKQDEHKFESIAGSIRKAFAGNAMKEGETVRLGKSPDDAPTVIESQEPVEPFPIDLLTTEGLLDKHEINRESDEDVLEMKKTIQNYDLANSAQIEQMKEGVKIRIKDKVLFEKGSIEISNSSIAGTLKKIISLMRDNDWALFIEGYADPGESYSKDKKIDAFGLSALRAQAIRKALFRRGVRPNKMTAVFYGDSRSKEGQINRKVEFVLRKRDLSTKGKRVNTQ